MQAKSDHHGKNGRYREAKEERHDTISKDEFFSKGLSADISVEMNQHVSSPLAPAISEYKLFIYQELRGGFPWPVHINSFVYL